MLNNLLRLFNITIENLPHILEILEILCVAVIACMIFFTINIGINFFKIRRIYKVTRNMERNPLDNYSLYSRVTELKMENVSLLVLILLGLAIIWMENGIADVILDAISKAAI